MKRIVDWLMAMRLWSLTASAIPVLIGAALAALDGTFSWVMLALTLVCGCSLHVATNLLNTYGDYASGVDQVAQTLTSPQLVTGTLRPVAVFRVGLGVLLGASALAVVIIAMSGWGLLWFAVPGVLGCGFYTTGLRYKYLGFGVPGAFTFAGVLLVGASYFAQTGTMTWGAAIASLPISCMVGGLLLGNDLRDMDSDREMKIQTTALFLGPRGACTLFYALHLLPHIVIIGASLAHVIPYWCLLTLLAAPLTFSVLKTTRDGFRLNDHAKVAKLEGMTAGTHFVFGVLMVAGLVTAVIF
ncbi:MAG: prenyltransferase [Kiritimatiellaeota bacterium]|nr:prenyltransferase [Kiritimatiellota bacterium]